MSEIRKEDFCCSMMASWVIIPGERRIFDDGDWEDKIIWYLPNFDEYGIPIQDGGSSMVTIQCCPWCGRRLPESKRDAWFDAILGMGIDPGRDEIPEPYQTQAWWAEGSET